MTVLAGIGGGFILVAFVVIVVLAVVVGYYSRRGNDIAQHPTSGTKGDGEPAAPGAADEDRIGGKTAGEQDRFDTHGTQ